MLASLTSLARLLPKNETKLQESFESTVAHDSQETEASCAANGSPNEVKDFISL